MAAGCPHSATPSRRPERGSSARWSGNDAGWLARSRVSGADTAIPVTLRIRTRRICGVVRAFNPSGVKVNSAQSDSAVRCMHGELESYMGRRVRC
jgi:hypothetical protein